MIKEEVKISQAEKKDLEEVLKLGRKFEDALKASKLKKAHFHEQQEFIEFIRNPKENVFLVAKVKNKVVGFIYVKILSHDWCMIDNLAVDERYQKHGIGSMLLEELYKILKKRKVSYIQILEEIHHKKTRKFWHEKGFREEKVFVWADKWLNNKKL
jgi:ribosomal protein S18 acetylase RimI-like enzyme